MLFGSIISENTSVSKADECERNVSTSSGRLPAQRDGERAEIIPPLHKQKHTQGTIWPTLICRRVMPASRRLSAGGNPKLSTQFLKFIFIFWLCTTGSSSEVKGQEI